MSDIARATAPGSPPRTRSDRLGAVTMPGSLVEELARNDEALDLARAFADRQELDVAEVFLGRIVLHEPVTPVNLHAVVRGLDGDLAGEQLGHRRLARHTLAAILEIRRAIRQQPRRLDPGGIVGQLPLDGLERRDRLAELPALPG